MRILEERNPSLAELHLVETHVISDLPYIIYFEPENEKDSEKQERLIREALIEGFFAWTVPWNWHQQCRLGDSLVESKVSFVAIGAYRENIPRLRLWVREILSRERETKK